VIRRLPVDASGFTLLDVPACEGSSCDVVRFTRAHPGLGFAGVDVPAS